MRLRFSSLIGIPLLAFLGCNGSDGPPDDPSLPVNGLTGVTFLEQGWSEEVQQLFWFTSQGSQIIPYDWFLVLEQESSQDLFRSEANIKPFGYIPTKPSEWNPDGLPVGFARDVDSADGQHWMGVTCAACHTSQIDFKGTSMFIDGAPTLADFTTFFGDMVAAMSATVKDDGKFDRFAKKVLKGGYSAAKAETLREALLRRTLFLLDRIKVNEAPYPYGHARLDAFGEILNQVLVVGLSEPDNVKPPNAPVSYPFLWGTHQSNVVQWNGSAPNIEVLGFPIGALARNIGEVLGVFGALDIAPKKILPPNYKSSVNKRNLLKLEEWVKTLQAPNWPGDILPAIDPEKAAVGKALYQEHCVSCHSLDESSDPNRRYQAVMTPIADVKTDPMMADNFADRVGKTGIIEGTPKAINIFKKFEEEGCGRAMLLNSVTGVILHRPFSSLLSTEGGIDADSGLGTISISLRGGANQDHVKNYLGALGGECFDGRAYKARPLNGIWATAPYLHNGSVPNLRQLLEEPENRVKEFKVGSREFDPVNVGQVTSEGPSTLDTSLEGNSNSGHDYGTTLTEDEKWALVEYMKSL